MIKGLVFSLQFLTRIPLKTEVGCDNKTVARSVMFFPFAGMLIGAVTAAAYCLMLFAGRDLSAVAAVAALIFITGGLHIDGLADTCDGFFSSRSSEKILEIMKDSRVGTFGVIAVVLDILVKYVIISKLQTDILPVLMFSCANARLASAMLISFAPGARPGGIGAMFSGSGAKKHFFIGALLYIGCLLPIAGFDFRFLIPLAASLAVSLPVALKSCRTIGGLTGDVYGANIEICEIASMAAFWWATAST